MKHVINQHQIQIIYQKELTKYQKIPQNQELIYIKNVDIPSGNEHLNRFFSAELFMDNHGMGEATQEEKMLENKLLDG